MSTKKVIVMIKKGNRDSIGVVFDNEDEAKEFLIEKYRLYIKQLSFFDYKNTYISEEHTYAKISAGVYSIKIMLCKNIRNFKK